LATTPLRKPAKLSRNFRSKAPWPRDETGIRKRKGLPWIRLKTRIETAGARTDKAVKRRLETADRANQLGIWSWFKTWQEVPRKQTGSLDRIEGSNELQAEIDGNESLSNGMLTNQVGPSEHRNQTNKQARRRLREHHCGAYLLFDLVNCSVHRNSDKATWNQTEVLQADESVIDSC
jgi:hypothetical protein